MLHPIVRASDNLVHSMDIVVEAYNDHILDKIPDKVKTLSIWLDGVASQFKNYLILATMKVLLKKHDVQISYDFFATSHGKGLLDGIAGTVKCVDLKAVQSRKFTMTGAASFMAAARSSNVKVIEMTFKDIEATKEFWFS